MIRAIIFDCFGVLYLDSSRHFYEHQIPNYELLLPELLELNKASDYGLISHDEWINSVAELAKVDRSFVAENIDGIHKRNDALFRYVEQLRSEYMIGMCSNIGPGGMDQFFSQSEREKLFDVVVLSGDEGIVKPNPAIFELVAERLGARPRECVMIDDIEDNCSGADAAGMRAIHYVSNAQMRHELHTLLEKS